VISRSPDLIRPLLRAGYVIVQNQLVFLSPAAVGTGSAG
jgi:hypothetical protein